eukprot:COSAG06_NODE_6796_length_2778_cov_5.645763_2_plen_47_part_00
MVSAVVTTCPAVRAKRDTLLPGILFQRGAVASRRGRDDGAARTEHA